MIIGADPHDLLALSSEFETAAAALELSRRSVDTALAGAWWRGPMAERFLQTWIVAHAPALQTAQALIRDAGRVLERQAIQQQDTSDGGVGHHGIAAPTPTALLAPTGPRARIAGAVAPPRPAVPDFAASDSAATDFAAATDSAATDTAVTDFAAAQREIQARIRRLLMAEQREVARSERWLGLGGALGSQRRLSEIRRSIADYRGLVGDDRQILLLGDGQVAEVFGDLDSAQRVGVWVPGVGTNVGDFTDPDTLAAKRIWNSDPDLVMIEWLGYDPPDTIPEAAIELGHSARRAGEDLNRFVSHLKETVPAVVIGGHSYGSVVAAYAASVGTRADALVLAGSPGVPVASVARFDFDGVPGSAENVSVVQNRYDPVTVGHLADEAITASLDALVAPLPGGGAVGWIASRVGTSLSPDLRHVVDGRSPTWWSEMAHDPNRAGFGALLLPANDTRLSGSVTGSNHRYDEPGSVSLESLQRAFRR